MPNVLSLSHASGCFVIKLERPYFQETREKKLLLSRCNATSSSNKVFSPKIQDKLRGTYSHVSHFLHFLEGRDTQGFVSAAGSRSHAGTQAASLCYFSSSTSRPDVLTGTAVT